MNDNIKYFLFPSTSSLPFPPFLRSPPRLLFPFSPFPYQNGPQMGPNSHCWADIFLCNFFTSLPNCVIFWHAGGSRDTRQKASARLLPVISTNHLNRFLYRKFYLFCDEIDLNIFPNLIQHLIQQGLETLYHYLVTWSTDPVLVLRICDYCGTYEAKQSLY